MVAARLAGRWHAAVPCLLAAQATTRRRRWPPSGRDKLATDGRAAAREKFFLETLVSLSLSLSLSLGAIWRCFAAKEDSRGRTGSACLLRRAGVRVTPPRTQAMGPASTQRAHRRQARRILCERRRLGPYCVDFCISFCSPIILILSATNSINGSSLRNRRKQLQSSASLERERLPQWSHAETAAFLAVRAELDHSFLTTKRNKALWEFVSARLQGQGFARTPDQCKSKWKNLVTRFKGTEAAAAAASGHPAPDADHASAAAAAQQARQFPFHDEMRRIFDARVERAQALERKRAKGKDVQKEDDEGGGEGEDDDDEEELEAEMGEEEAGSRVPAEARGGGGAKKRRRKHAAAAAAARARTADQGEVEAMLREFMRRQVEMEERWMEAAEAREAERRAREEEWRNAMVALGEERLALVRRWREREEAWRARAEEREERRHQLVAALLAKLGGGSS
ncbi:hypothetical protein PAHAL_3G104200 [Panicum hallii]|uniref:Myb-like domain-containing protein n=1 Tax=Panicum hallii TaxID=206008 RepID=A0A2T8KHR7_9POAL|nr:hypothetical protein PAHAL_3G104200 [Panicum hallii]